MATDLLPPGYGDGWLSSNARDLLRIVLWAGQDRDVLVRVARAAKPGRVANVTTVENVLQQMLDEGRAA